MGSGKKKYKKKRRRQRSSSDDDEGEYIDSSAEKYNSKRKSETYMVEDARLNTLQAIADNYSYGRSCQKNSKYDDDDIPETEEYVYDQFGDIVQTSHQDAPMASSSQVKSSVSSRIKEPIIIDDPTEHREVKKDKSFKVKDANEVECITSDYSTSTRRFSSKEKNKVSTSEIGSEKYNTLKSQSHYLDHKSSVPPPPPQLPPPKNSHTSAQVKSILKSSQGKPEFVSDYSHGTGLFNNSPDYIAKSKTSKTDTSNLINRSSQSKEMVCDSLSYSQDRNQESEQNKTDYNSADYILKQIREQTKIKPTKTLPNVTLADYNTQANYSQKSDLIKQSDYRVNYSSSEYNNESLKRQESSSYVNTHSESNDHLSIYAQKRYSQESYTQPVDPRIQKSNFAPKRKSPDISVYDRPTDPKVAKKSQLQDYSSIDPPEDPRIARHINTMKNNTLHNYRHELVSSSSGYDSIKDDQGNNSNINYNTDTYKKGLFSENDHDGSTFNEKQSSYDKFSGYSYPRDSMEYNRDEQDQKSYRDEEEIEADDYVQDVKLRPNSPPIQHDKYLEVTSLQPPGVDWPFEESSGSTYDEYSEWKNVDEGKHTQFHDVHIEKKGQSRNTLKRNNEQLESEVVPPSTSSSDSLSIEETNKLRAKLGLKPLNVDQGSSATSEKSYSEREDVHTPACNLSDKKHEEKMRERMEAIREKRKINKKLQKIKGLGEEDDPVLDSAAAWVAKSRMQEKEKAMAAKRAKMLEEMDEEFGVSKLMSKGILKKKSKYVDYGSSSLEGMKIEHKSSEFLGGESTILTLKDKDVLDEDEDILYNVNVRESEEARLNVKNKKKGSGYQAYDEFDEETGEFKVRTVLDKYDEEIEGKKKDSFRINTDGMADTEEESQIEKIRAILKSQQVSLVTTEMKPSRDYYTSEEMVSFKKHGKKRRKVRKREILKADDLLKMDLVDSRGDRGPRKLKSAMKNSTREDDTAMDMDIVPAEIDELDYFVAANQRIEDEDPLIEDDEAEQELQLALRRSRRAKLRTVQEICDENTTVEKMAKEVLSKPQSNVQESEVVSSKLKKKNKIVLDSTSEFCRTLGELPSLPNIPLEESENTTEDNMDIEEHTSSSTTVASGWETVELTEGPKIAADDDDDDDVLEAEPIPTGLAATLNLANMKGYLKDGKEKVRKFDPLNLPETKSEVDVEKLRDEEKNKYTRGGYERERDRDSRYDPYAWKEKINYKPDIKLEYVDNKGRQMNQKEAFRLLSHKFHGKGSGKLKTEKRSKKLLDEKKLQMMSSIDTPLNTAALFKDKQKQSQSAYLVLSGGGKNILSGETLKK